MYQSSITPEEIENLPLTAFPGRIHIITEKGPDFDAAISHLSACRAIGFDTETKPIFTPHAPRPRTALLQLSSLTDAFLFRLSDMGLPDELASILSSTCITKVGAAVIDDIAGLEKHNRFKAHRFLDLQQFAERFDIQDKSLKKLSAIILGRRISKAQQCSNWEATVLSEAQELYAATDAWICLIMYNKLLGYDINL